MYMVDAESGISSSHHLPQLRYDCQRRRHSAQNILGRVQARWRAPPGMAYGSNRTPGRIRKNMLATAEVRPFRVESKRGKT